MAISEECGIFLAGLLNTIKNESVEWQKQHQADQINLKREQAIAETQLRLDLAAMEARFVEEKIQIQMAERHKNKEFSEYLESIDEAKKQFLKRYPEMPKPLALLICHHASDLLKEAWNNPNAPEKLRKHNMYTHFMVTMCTELMEGSEIKALPEKTLELIQGVDWR